MASWLGCSHIRVDQSLTARILMKGVHDNSAAVNTGEDIEVLSDLLLVPLAKRSLPSIILKDYGKTQSQ